MRAIAAAATAMGLLLIVLSQLWPLVSNGRQSWTEQDAQRKQELERELHKLHYQLAPPSRSTPIHGQPPADGSALIENRQRYDKLKSELEDLNRRLEGARDRPRKVAVVLWWLGLVLAVLGVIVLIANPRK